MNARPNTVAVLAGYEGIQAGQEAIYKDLHQHPNCPTPSIAPPTGSPGNCRNMASRSRLASAVPE